MTTQVNGFRLEVTRADGLPHIRVSLQDGTVVMDTDQVSVIGLQKLPAVFEAAAAISLRQLERTGGPC